MGSFVDELNTICKGNCKECETRACLEGEMIQEENNTNLEEGSK